MAQFGLMNNGIRVRDPSQMFMFGKVNWAQESAGLLTKNKSQQAGIFSKPFVGNQLNQSSGSVDHKLSKKEDDNMNAAAEASSSDENQPNFGLTPTSQSQSPPVNRLDPCKITQQMVKTEDGYIKKLSQSFKSVKKQLPNQNNVTSHLVSFKKEDGQRWSTRPANILLYSTVQQNKQKFSVTGSCELPSTSYAENNRIRKRSNTPSSTSKKRKFSACQQSKQVTKGSSRLHDISTAELEWARSVVRLPEKLDEFNEKIAGSCWMIKRKRRLISTTQLMQLLFQPPPAIILSEDAITHGDVVTYYASKLALDSSLCLLAGKNMASKSRSEKDLLKAIDGFIDRSKRLEADVLRLEKGLKGESLFQVRMAFKDLEKVSFINRFARFHTRRPKVTVDMSSSTMPTLCPQSIVKAIPMPKMVPEGQNCLFL